VAKTDDAARRLPQAKALRDAGLNWARESITYPVDSEDSAARKADQRLRAAAVRYTDALRALKKRIRRT
jgi:hypothetical protein